MASTTTRNNVFVFPGKNGKDEFAIDKSDYCVILELISQLDGPINIHEIQDMVKLDGNCRVTGFCLDTRKHRMLNHGNLQVVTVPSSISKLSKIKMLFLPFFVLGDLPEEMGDLVDLEYLYLNGSVVRLPSSIGRCINLKCLCLNHATIGCIPREIGTLANLETLHLSYSDVSLLPSSSICQSKNMEDKPGARLWPNIKRLQISQSILTSYPHFVETLTNLVDLSLDIASISTLPNDAWNLPSIERLSLFVSDSEGIISIPEWIWELKSLKELEIHQTLSPAIEEDWNEIPEEVLMDLVKRLPSLGSIYYRNKSLSDKLVYALACNRARSRTAFEKSEYIHLTPNSWPEALSNASQAFVPYLKDNDNFALHNFEIPRPDATYRILTNGLKSFVEVLRYRSPLDYVHSQMKQDRNK